MNLDDKLDRLLGHYGDLSDKVADLLAGMRNARTLQRVRHRTLADLSIGRMSLVNQRVDH